MQETRGWNWLTASENALDSVPRTPTQLTLKLYKDWCCVTLTPVPCSPTVLPKRLPGEPHRSIKRMQTVQSNSYDPSRSSAKAMSGVHIFQLTEQPWLQERFFPSTEFDCSFSSLTYSEQQRCNSTTTTTNPGGVTENTFLESTTAVITTKTSVNKKPVGFLIKPTFQWSLREKKNSLWLDCHDHFHWHFPCNFSRLTVSILSASQKKSILHSFQSLISLFYPTVYEVKEISFLNKRLVKLT